MNNYDNKCNRCGKIFNHAIIEMHTCTPTELWRLAMIEGIKLAYDEVSSEYDPCDATEKFKRFALARLDNLITKYSGE